MTELIARNDMQPPRTVVGRPFCDGPSVCRRKWQMNTKLWHVSLFAPRNGTLRWFLLAIKRSGSTTMSTRRSYQRLRTFGLLNGVVFAQLSSCVGRTTSQKKKTTLSVDGPTRRSRCASEGHKRVCHWQLWPADCKLPIWFQQVSAGLYDLSILTCFCGPSLAEASLFIGCNKTEAATEHLELNLDGNQSGNKVVGFRNFSLIFLRAATDFACSSFSLDKQKISFIFFFFFFFFLDSVGAECVAGDTRRYRKAQQVD